MKFIKKEETQKVVTSTNMKLEEEAMKNLAIELLKGNYTVQSMDIENSLREAFGTFPSMNKCPIFTCPVTETIVIELDDLTKITIEKTSGGIR